MDTNDTDIHSLKLNYAHMDETLKEVKKDMTEGFEKTNTLIKDLSEKLSEQFVTKTTHNDLKHIVYGIIATCFGVMVALLLSIF